MLAGTSAVFRVVLGLLGGIGGLGTLLADHFTLTIYVKEARMCAPP
jgi:hypothetical protein